MLVYHIFFLLNHPFASSFRGSSVGLRYARPSYGLSKPEPELATCYLWCTADGSVPGIQEEGSNLLQRRQRNIDEEIPDEGRAQPKDTDVAYLFR